MIDLIDVGPDNTGSPVFVNPHRIVAITAESVVNYDGGTTVTLASDGILHVHSEKEPADVAALVLAATADRSPAILWEPPAAQQVYPCPDCRGNHTPDEPHAEDAQ